MPKKYVCPSEVGRADWVNTPEEEQILFEKSGELREDDFVYGLVETENPVDHSLAEKLRQKFMKTTRTPFFGKKSWWTPPLGAPWNGQYQIQKWVSTKVPKAYTLSW